MGVLISIGTFLLKMLTVFNRFFFSSYGVLLTSFSAFCGSFYLGYSVVRVALEKQGAFFSTFSETYTAFLSFVAKYPVFYWLAECLALKDLIGYTYLFATFFIGTFTFLFAGVFISCIGLCIPFLVTRFVSRVVSYLSLGQVKM